MVGDPLTGLLRALRLSIVALACVCATAALARAGAPIPGRLVSISVGAAGNPSFGDSAASPPALLRVAPELQLAWGMQLAGQAFVFTRLDFLGSMIPIGPSGYGADLGVGWTAALHHRGWSPTARFTLGGLVLASGGEVAFGPDYRAYGFRMELEAGIARASRQGKGVVMWSVLAGVHATALPDVEPCAPSGDCSDVMIGPTVRGEVAFLF